MCEPEVSNIVGHRVEFYPEPHIYKVDGEVKPSVTQILQAACVSPDYSEVDHGVLENKRRIGKEVHRICEAINKDLISGLDINSIDSYIDYTDIYRFGNYVDAYVAYCHDTGFRPTHAETMVYSPSYDYVGTVDIVGMLKTDRVIIDLKTPSSDHPSYGLQTAAYQRAWEECYGLKITRRLSLLLHPNGKYTPCPHSDPLDFNIFLAALVIKRWKEAKGYGQRNH